MQEHFLSKARLDIFRPFTGRHRAVFFEVVTEIYERTLGVNADYEIVLDRSALTEIIVDALAKNRSLIFSGEDGDEELDDAADDREYADKVRRRLKLFGMIEEYNDSAHLKVLWRFTPEGKRIAKMFADTRRKTSVARQRSVRACKGALKAFADEGNHEYLVDAYEYASTIFDDVCQVSDLFAEHQRRIMGHSFSTSKEALAAYMLGVNDFDKRASRYFDSDNIYNHASDIVDLTESIASMNPVVLEAVDRKISEENPALEEEANGEAVHAWMLARIRRVVESTRDIKHEELHRVVGEFSTNYAILIGRLIKLSAVGDDDPLIRFATIFAAAGDEERDEISREMLSHLFPLRADLVDPADLKIAERADRVRTPTKIVRKQPSREERLQAAIRNAMTAAFAVPAKEVVGRVHAAVLAGGGSTSVMQLPVEGARSLLAAMSAVEIVRSLGAETGLTVSEGEECRSNGMFRAVDHKISERA
ncbi:Wadjet anti-phage system protein JetA family protein [Rhodopseudomonas sp. BR0G17]|uniref:Wadjet anti-phage system protein JetA family protein n=1 Tax=Rhodopseudomonas sp. BR0G17 TaxID=2269368 RepID=UPI0013E02004|nr:Wadjet anti-phage system protein JetA family protein [Rhodopseudomonas sp. BR0G17]NEW97148.1 hypothetical protein [Rhodopseudomonas sp. BR0G17]